MNMKVILEIIERLDALERKQRNLIRGGHIKSVEGRKVVVDFDRESDDDYETPLIPWLPVVAGEVLNWRAPTVGEQVIVLNLSGGDDETNCVALPALYCNEFLPDTLDPNKTYTSFNDVFRVETDSSGNHTLFAQNSIVFSTKSFAVNAEQVTVNATSSVAIETNTYSRKASAANTQGLHNQKGNVNINGELDVSVSVKTPAILSYAPGAFSMTQSGATISSATITSCKVNGKAVEGHTSHPF
ncbi:phage baseplate assembly protein V [Vibrio aestuarianus]|uniref:phage baseplate assembly protein V n=1 Tax=Vibrio aestuarianus TaxID=28171 RepID=UPI001593F48F|nr:phage baseplate assembly protein V [Vibrio aestuarianus]NGZ18029.1 phage baseplate assembly protein V [Vibrio aestuarianus]